jgi:hypothetical protein
MRYSDYIIFVDESGDHGLKNIDPAYPVFVLCFCIFNKQDYSTIATPALNNFKFKYFGHPEIILHSHDIRKQKRPFEVLTNKEIRIPFLNELTGLIKDIPFTLITTAILKEKLRERYQTPENPYEIALQFCMERAFYFLQNHQQHEALTDVIIERRGADEDRSLELVFRRVCDGANYKGQHLNLSPFFVDKKSNSVGLQIADLCAYPVGKKIIRPQQENVAYQILEPKFYKNKWGKKEGWGFKTFP